MGSVSLREGSPYTDQGVSQLFQLDKLAPIGVQLKMRQSNATQLCLDRNMLRHQEKKVMACILFDLQRFLTE